MNLELKKKIKNIPQKPGVYFWLDKKGVILYIGRATSLRNRLSQYFLKNIEPRISEMVDLANNIKYEVCDSLLEAIILEAKYIKKFWPKYNIKDRDDRSFIYIVIPKIAYPKLIIVRGKDLKKFPTSTAKIFGPYQSFQLVQNALKLIRRLFPYSTCSVNSGKACFDYQIGLCPGACIGKISSKDYLKNIRNIILLLNGEKKKLIKRLIKENPEKAKALKHLQDVSLLTKEDSLGENKVSRLEGYDISHHGGKESFGSMVVFENGEANKNEYRLFKIKDAPEGDDERALAEVLIRRFKHKEWLYPELIMIDGGSPQISFIDKIFQKNNIIVPIVGISKFGGDKLVYSVQTGKSLRDLTENIKPTLLRLREEAHRFANYGRKKSLKYNINN